MKNKNNFDLLESRIQCSSFLIKIDAMASKLARQAEEQAMKLLKTAFEDTDTDKSGTICAREIKQLFEKAGLHDTTDAEIKVSGFQTEKVKTFSNEEVSLLAT